MKKDFKVEINELTPISVAMVTYNSSRFIKEQIDTILDNLRDIDELVISDDGSTDTTIEIINSYKNNDNRIKLYQIEHQGCNGNYENAIKHTSNPIIFLSDDDNVWEMNKIEEVLKTFKNHKNVGMVMHDCTIVDEKLDLLTEKTFFQDRNAKPGLFRNIMKPSWGGSLMAIRKECLSYVLPFPKNLPVFYDEWIGLIISKKSKVIFLPLCLSKWRRHSNSASTGFVCSDGSIARKKKQPKSKIFFRIKQRISTRVKKIILAIKK